MSCCPPGSAPYLAADHNDEGKIGVTTDGGVSYYQVGSGTSGVLILPDVWGWNSGRTRAIADDLAKQGLSVWVPKILPAFEGGTDDDGLPPAFPIVDRFMSDLVPLIKSTWGPEAVVPNCLKVCQAMEEAGVKQKAWIGMCYGAWIGMHLSKHTDFVCGGAPHPSVHLDGMVGGDPVKLASECKCPVAFYPAGEVGKPGADPDIYDVGGTLFEALEANFKGKNESKRFPTMIHGWVPRGSIKPNETNFGTGDAVKRGVQECMDNICCFFKRHGLMGLTMPAVIYYFPAGGRAELARTIAAAGGVALLEGGVPGEGFKKSEYGSPSGVPLLQHGPLKMSQSTAIENYLSLLAFPDLSPQQRAIDSQFCSIKEDVAAGTYKTIFAPWVNEDKAKAGEELGAVAKRWYPVIEELCPADGFINGEGHPTAADVAVMNICDAVMPFEIANRLGGVDWATYPKMRALANRAAAYPPLRDYLAKSKTFTGNPRGL